MASSDLSHSYMYMDSLHEAWTPNVTLVSSPILLSYDGRTGIPTNSLCAFSRDKVCPTRSVDCVEKYSIFYQQQATSMPSIAYSDRSWPSKPSTCRIEDPTVPYTWWIQIRPL